MSIKQKLKLWNYPFISFCLFTGVSTVFLLMIGVVTGILIIPLLLSRGEIVIPTLKYILLVFGSYDNKYILESV